jgi:vacuolar-type H+-ATPase subunit H
MTSQSPLAEIRSAELGAARAVVAANEEAERRIGSARSEAVRMVDEARARGRATADQRHKAQLDAAEVQAAEISQSVEQRVEALRRDVIPEIDRLVDAMFGVVLPGPE